MIPRTDILVIKLSALGDFVLALPAFAQIRAAHPNVPITLLTTPPFETLAKASPYFDRVWTDGRPGGFGAWLALIARIRRARFARAYDLQCNDRTNLIFQVLRPFPPAWSGTAAGCGLPYDDADRMETHSLERQARQLQLAGIWPDAPTAPMSAPPPDVSWLIAGADTVAPAVRLALLIPGSAVNRPRKRWPAESYGALAAGLIERGFDVAVIGSAQEHDIAATIGEVAPGARDLTGKTDFAAIARLAASAAVVVGNDTGPTHLAAAAGAPTITLFSADSRPELSAPRGEVTVLRRDDLADLGVSDVLAAVEATARVDNGAFPWRRALNKRPALRI